MVRLKLALHSRPGTDHDLDSLGNSHWRFRGRKWARPRRSWWDGFDGPICKAWLVRGFPTIYILDAKGTIRFKNVRGEAMDRAVEQLLAELDQKK